ncbi:MAG: hypothetical protein Harvfovirus12_8 [Harvfovirus sp.]|uniref:RING-type domain-containing protein n=1 Tax=Harvfovirus sp. TaxID=2487768 RepID=A0A3G5A1B0_9VIRU|nr:MAG: hypothetical protein Harvfovirus12_8 [Harvfovirus sp.]
MFDDVTQTILWLWNPILYSEMPVDVIYSVLGSLNERSLVYPLGKSLYLKNLLYVLVNKFGMDVVRVNEVLVSVVACAVDEKLVALVFRNLSNMKIVDVWSKEIFEIYIVPFVKKLKEVVPVVVSKKDLMIHKGYPEPHPIDGMVSLELMECYYKGCHRFFGSIESLKGHLIDNNAYIHGMHKSHENITCVEIGWGYKSPVEIIKKNGLTQCPALICNKKNQVFTTDELVYHFQELGIRPYWTAEWKAKVVEEKAPTGKAPSEKPIVVLNEMMNIIDEGLESSLCICCLNNSRNIVFFPCNHQIICFDCEKQLESTNCLICKEVIRYRFPTAL